MEQEKKRVMVVSCDVYRPAAIEQLQTLAAQVGAVFQPSAIDQPPAEIARNALTAARQQLIDVLLVDTAGRLHVDEEMMHEIRTIHAAVSPRETLFVVDSMTGQDAANTAQAFNASLDLTGIILTKTDGDARGGAALSMRVITGKPIKFLGSGEKVEALQPFHPQRIASRILGMGDVLTLIEQVQQKVDRENAEKLAHKMRKGAGFDLEDFRSQLEQMINLGGIGSLMDKLPGMAQLPQQLKSRVDDHSTRHMIAIINSMTPQERRFPDIIRGSRKKRIAMGSGLQVQAVNRLLKQHGQMQKMMKKMGKGGLGKMMKNLGRLQGQMPPGMMPGGGRKPPF
jgi:signal recognition particle subunit SRP54